MYVNDDGQVVAIRYDAWKVVFLENRGQAFEVWREPFTELRVPLLFNLRRDPFERAQHNSNTYNDWFLSRAFVIVPLQELAGKFPHDDEGLSAQPDTRLVQSGEGPKADRSRGAWRMMLIISGCCCRSRRCSRLTSAGGRGMLLISMAFTSTGRPDQALRTGPTGWLLQLRKGGPRSNRPADSIA